MRKPNSIIALLFIQNIVSLKTCLHVPLCKAPIFACPSAVSGYERMFIFHIAVVICQVVVLCILAVFFEA